MSRNAGPAAAFGADLRRRRTDSRLTQEQLAERSGLSVRTVRELERGRVRYPRPESLRLLAEVLGLAGADLAEFEAVARRPFWAERTAAAAAQERATVPAQLPADVTGFTGRSGLLHELDALLEDDDSHAVRITVISGGPGVGKSALAAHWGHRVRHHFPDGQLYLNLQGYSASPPLSPDEALTRLLRGLGVDSDRIPPDETEAAALLRSLLADTRTLIVLDDARHVEHVRPLLPGGPGCHVLVTSRTALGGLVARNGANQLTVPALDPAESRELLTRLLGTHATVTEPGAVDDLAGLCGHLPLALRIAAANVVGPGGASVAAFTDRLRSDNRLAELEVPTDPDTMLRGAFALSYAALPAPAQRLFRLLVAAPGPDVTVAEAAALFDTAPDDVRRVLDQLAAAHFVEQRAPGRYAQPDLLRLYAVAQAAAQDSGPLRSAAWKRLLRHYQHTLDAAARRLYPEVVRLPCPYPEAVRPPLTAAGRADPFPDHRSAAAWLDVEMPTLQAAVLAAAKSGPEQAAWLLADGLRAWFHGRGAVSAWHAVATAALAAAERVGDAPAQAAAHLSLSGAWTRQDRYVEAIRHGRRALELAERTGWVDGQVAAHAALGNLKRLAGEPDAAIAHLDRALVLSDRADLPSQPSIIENIAIVEHEMGRLGEAAVHYTHALELLSPGAAGRAAPVRTDLGAVLNGMGRPDEALGHLTAALAVHRELGDSCGEAYNLRCQAEVHRDMGRLGRALELAQSALHLSREVDDLRLEAQAQETVATVHQAAGRLSEAMTAFDRALGLASATGNSYTEAQARIGIAVARAAGGEAGPALADAEAALRIARRAHHLVLEGQALVAAADAALLLDRPDVAHEHARAALDVHQRTGYVPGRAAADRVLNTTVTPP